MKTSRQLWEEFRDSVFDEPLDSETEEELSMMFYAGVEATFRQMLDAGRAHGNVASPELVEKILCFRDENIMNAIGAGRC